MDIGKRWVPLPQLVDIKLPLFAILENPGFALSLTTNLAYFDYPLIPKDVLSAGLSIFDPSYII